MILRKITIATALAAVATCGRTSVNAFVPGRAIIRHRFSQPSTTRKTASIQSDPYDFREQCDTEWPTIFSGVLPPEARLVDPGKILSKSKVKSTKNGEDVNLGSLIDNGVTIVVFLRSFGWPFCQELILQYARRRDELLARNIEVYMVSIGKPEVGKQLIEHLEVKNGEDFIFADPENRVYDDLYLNKGVQATFFNPATPFAIRDRLFDGNSKELFEVLSKWMGAFFIPPKREQAFIQGGTFIFDNTRTVYAHYDESTAAHADMRYVMRLARNVMISKAKKS